MAAIKRKADQGSTLSKREKVASSDRSAKRRKSDGAAELAPAKAKPESSAPKSVFKDEEKSFPRGGASVLTPLEHKQIQIKANQDVLFEQAGVKRSGGDAFSDMGSDDGEEATPKSSKKKPLKKNKRSQDDGEKEQTIRAEGLSYKVTIAATACGKSTNKFRNCHLEPLSSAKSPRSPTKTLCSPCRTTSSDTSHSPPSLTSSTNDWRSS